MLSCPDKYLPKTPLENVNQELLKIKGELGDKEARATLGKFLRANLGMLVEILTGITLAPYQEATLKAFFNRNYNMCVWGRGSSKTFISAIYVFLQMILEPNSKILVASATFRNSRLLFAKLEEIVSSPEAKLLAQVFTDEWKTKSNDLYVWRIANGSSVTCVPLSPKIRGQRANILILDEFLLLTESVVTTILVPFLAANLDAGERLKAKREEERKIKSGHMKEEDKKIFAEKTKMIVLSSASYTFDYLYKLYKEWEENIFNALPVESSKYFISHLSYEAIPEEMLSQSLLEEVKNAEGEANASFRREFKSEFLDESDSYFSAKKMTACTLAPGEYPHLELWGDKNAIYLMAIDPSFSNSPSSDDFAMVIARLENGQPHIVHQYAVAGGDLKDHINYFYYLTKAFNPRLIITDTTGGDNFFESVNLSEKFLKDEIEYSSFEFDSTKEGTEEYPKVLKDARNSYNLQSKKICIDQIFTSDFIRKANEHLQANFDHKRIWFGSKITPHENILDITSKLHLPLDLTKQENIIDLIDEQERLIDLVKRECSLIEVRTTAKGTQTFDLPVFLKKSTATDRARKDSYSALFLVNWAAKIYNDIMTQPEKEVVTSFMPKVIR